MTNQPLQEFSLRPEAMREAMNETEGLHESVYRAYLDLIKSGDYKFEGSPDPKQVNIIGFRPLMFNKGGLETQAVLFGLQANTDITWFENAIAKPQVNPLLKEMYDSIQDLALAAAEDGSDSSPSSIARRMDSGLLGGVVVVRDVATNAFSKLHFWHKDLANGIQDGIDEMREEIEEEMEDDDMLTPLELSGIGVINQMAKFIMEVPDRADVIMINGFMSRAEELGPVVHVKTASLHTAPHANPKY